MQTKLTLRLDDRVIKRAKRISKIQRKSISKIVEEHLRQVTMPNTSGTHDFKIPDWINELGGSTKSKRKHKTDLKLKYLLEKHVK